MIQAQRSQILSVNLEDKTFDVDYDYEPEEKEVRYDSNGTGHPGSPAEVIINKVTYNDEDWTDFIFQFVGEDRITEEIWEHMESFGEY